MPTNVEAETSIDLPSLGESVEEATITRWLKRPGERVEAEEPLLEVSTDKVDTEIPAPVSGVLTKILVDENEVVSVGSPIAIITSDDGMSAASTPPAPSSPKASSSSDEPGHDEPPVVNPASSAQVTTASPSPLSDSTSPKPASQARSSTAEPRPKPVQVAAKRPPAPPATTEAATPPFVASTPGTASTAEKLPRIRQTIARAMVQSLQTSAQLTTVLEADVTEIARLREANKRAFFERTGVKLSFFPFFAKAAVAALAEHRMLNASLNATATEVTYHRGCQLGIAVDSPRGLMVPVICDAHNLNIEGLARAIARMADRVRTGKITADELAGGTFTLTNTGSRGALFDTPIINQPQTGILGTGAVVERVVPSRDRGGALQIGVGSFVYLSVTYDHRIVDGADAARFLTAIKRRLEGGFTAADLP